MRDSAATERRHAIVLVDHGSRRVEANDMLRDVARLVREAAPGAHVEIAHMELAPPSIADALRACVEAGATDITVHPYLLAPGRHSTEDIPRLTAEAASEHPGLRFRVTEPLGLDARIAAVILARVEEARSRDETERTTP